MYGRNYLLRLSLLLPQSKTFNDLKITLNKIKKIGCIIWTYEEDMGVKNKNPGVIKRFLNSGNRYRPVVTYSHLLIRLIDSLFLILIFLHFRGEKFSSTGKQYFVKSIF